MITPEEIEKKDFTVRRLKEGYDPQEVDDFLDALYGDYLQLTHEVGTLRARLKSASSAPTQPMDPVVSDVSRILAVAQRTADEQLAEANQAAADIVRHAGQQAEEIVATGHEKRHAIIGQLEVQRDALEQKVNELGSARDALSMKLRQALAGLEG